MSQNDVYVTWGIMALLIMVVASVGKQIDRFREEFQEFRELIRPEVDLEPELSPEDAAKAGSFWQE